MLSYSLKLDLSLFWALVFILELLFFSSKLKILGTGEIKDKINIEANLASKSAVKKLEKIGGSIQLNK